jgi:hypothetical protein
VIRYVCLYCLAAERAADPETICGACGGQLVEVTPADESMASAWADTQPGAVMVRVLERGAADQEGPSNTFRSVSS